MSQQQLCPDVPPSGNSFLMNLAGQKPLKIFYEIVHGCKLYLGIHMGFGESLDWVLLTRNLYKSTKYSFKLSDFRRNRLAVLEKVVHHYCFHSWYIIQNAMEILPSTKGCYLSSRSRNNILDWVNLVRFQ